MFSRAVFAAGVALGPVSSTELTCLENVEETRSQTERGGRLGSDQLLGAWAESSYSGHILCEGSNVTGGMIKTTTQLSRGGIGYKTGWQSANPHGECRWNINSVNGQSDLRGDAEEQNWNFVIDSKFEQYKVCGSGEGGAPWQFGKAMAIQHKHSGTGTTITGYAFLNDAAKTEALAGETLFSIPGVMSACQVEIVVAIPVNPSGDTSFEVSIYFHKDEGEAELNAGLRLNRSASGSLDISFLNGSAADGSNVVMTMATGLVCESTQTKIDDSAITIDYSDNFPADNRITYTATAASVAGCNMVYWDPTMTAFGSGSQDWPADSSESGSQSVSAAAAVFVSSAYALMQF